MSSISNLTLSDGQTSPASHTFVVLRGQSGSDKPSEWLEKTATIFAGFKRLTMLVRRPSGSTNTKTTAKLAYPAVTTVDGVQTVYATAYATLELTVPDNFSESDRKDLAAYIANFADTTAFRNAIVSAEPQF